MTRQELIDEWKNKIRVEGIILEEGSSLTLKYNQDYHERTLIKEFIEQLESLEEEPSYKKMWYNLKEYVDEEEESTRKAYEEFGGNNINQYYNASYSVVQQIMKRLEDMSNPHSARSMFDKLGYVQQEHFHLPSVSYTNDEREVAINFLECAEKGHKIHIYSTGDTYQDSGMITVEEINAINQKIKELGWEEE